MRELGIGSRTEVRAAKAESIVRELAPGSYDLVFLDPPYDYTTAQLEQLLAALAPALSPQALVVVERSSRTQVPAWPDGWGDDGTKTYGETVVHFGGPLETSAPSAHLE